MPETKSWKAHQGEIIDSVSGFDVIECRTCGFKHIIPIPTLEELDLLYQHEFYATENPNYFQDVEEDAEWWNFTYRNYYQSFEKYLPPNNQRLLEIGSGPGYFLKCGKELGWEVLGFEPSKQAAEYSQRLGMPVINKFFDESEAGKHGQFDVVYMNTVIEHLPDPAALLKCAQSVLNRDGLICIIAPNDYNPLQNILRNNLGYKHWWVSPPQHINYFDHDSISGLLSKLGFEIVESTATFPMEFFLLSGDNYVGNNELGRRCHFKRKTFEMNMYQYGREHLMTIYQLLAKQKIGREFVIIGRVKGKELPGQPK